MKTNGKILTLFALTYNLIAGLAFANPKYGPEKKPIAIPLRQANEYFREPGHTSPQFWSLMSFYVPQLSGGTCSIATAIMALNTALGTRSRTSDDKVITEPALIEEIKNKKWTEATLHQLNQNKYGATLDQYKVLLEFIFKDHGFEKVNVQAIHVNDSTQATKSTVQKLLKEFNQSQKKLLLVNFDQKKFTDDTEVGHYAPVGAYDEKRARVLILDPDREYYEPYWVSVDSFIQGMNTQDSFSHMNRGLIVITL